MSSVGSPAAQGPPPVISRGATARSAARLNSCGAPKASPAAAPSSVPTKRAFSSICCCVIALGCFLRRFASGRNVPINPPAPRTLLLAPQFRLRELEPVVPPEAALPDEERGHAEHAAREREIGVLPQLVLHLDLLRRRDQRFAL